jgi:predicted DNA-binding antitoxin AbrB/MazE fold protein
MPITIEAVYENGILRPIHPLPLADHERVMITVEPIRIRCADLMA